MKTMSMVARVSDCPETLDEARMVIDNMVWVSDEKTKQLTALKTILRDYLAMSSLDGRPERQELRAKLKELVK